MKSILKWILFLIQFSNFVQNFRIDLNSNELIEENNDRLLNSLTTNEDFLEDYVEASLQERINLCKNNLSDFDYDSLDEDERDKLFYFGNPCRVDCVVHRPQYQITTLFFTDRKTICGLQKVCVPDPLHPFVGICQKTNVSTTVSTIMTTTPTTQTTIMNTPTSKPTTTPPTTVSTTITSTATSTTSPTTDSITTETPSTPNQTTSTSTIGPTETFCRSAKYFRDRTDPECQRFYRCIGYGHNFQRIDMKCPNQTIFDEPIQSCQHPEEAIETCPLKIII